MADFSDTEKLNINFKHLFGLQGTVNTDPNAGGKMWYEEKVPSTHIIYPEDIWANSSLIPVTTTQAQAQAAATASGSIVEDRSQGEGITLVANGLDWDILTTTIIPQIGYQVTDVHPNATYIKSIINAVDNGGGSYTITLNSNSGVSAGSAVLQSRIYLTEDLASNGLAWFTKDEAGNTFSNNIKNFIPNARFGTGYAIRLYEADGTEIFTTQGAWIPNWQQGLILFGSGFTADDLGYSKPLYIEAFRYIGSFGGGSASIAGNYGDTLHHNGSGFAATDALWCDGNEVAVKNKLTISGVLITTSGSSPISSAELGEEGEVRWDRNFMYYHTGAFWVRSNFQKF